MLHHERLKPPIQDYPPNEWSLIEASFKPEFTAQTEAVLALGNGYLGMRGNPEEGSPSVQNGTFVNGFYESSLLSKISPDAPKARCCNWT